MLDDGFNLTYFLMQMLMQFCYLPHARLCVSLEPAPPWCPKTQALGRLSAHVRDGAALSAFMFLDPAPPWRSKTQAGRMSAQSKKQLEHAGKNRRGKEGSHLKEQKKQGETLVCAQIYHLALLRMELASEREPCALIVDDARCFSAARQFFLSSRRNSFDRCSSPAA
jgi:hypothetical protein